jgi:superfamily II DNA or RNA helicase
MSTFDIEILPKDANHCRIKCTPDIAQELSAHFSFEVPGAKFSPMFRKGIWDGRTKLFNLMTKEIYYGLIPYIFKFAKDSGYTITDRASLPDTDTITYELIEKFMKALKLHSRGEPIEIRDYQIEAIVTALKDNRRLLLSPTSSGKSLIIYGIVRWYSLQNRKFLLLVPNKGLVAQLFKDFADYSTENGWKVDNHCHMVYAGQSKTSEKPVIISTWQSLYKIGKGAPKAGKVESDIPSDYFDQFDVVIGDEAHLFKAASIVGIMSRCRNATKRIGTTGTLDGSDTNKLVLEGLFGTVHRVTSTKELMKAGQVTELKIKVLQLMYPDAVRKAASSGKKVLNYDQEMDYLTTLPSRVKFVSNLAVSQQKNTLVLFQYVDHGRLLYDMIESKVGDDRKVFFVSGDTDLTDRELVRSLTEANEGVIIVASYGTFSTGVNVRNIHSVIFASPSKSRVRNLQSIGRGLRLDDGKSECILYDIADDLSWKSRKNYTLLHMIERLKIYAEEKLTYKIIQVPFGTGNQI